MRKIKINTWKAKAPIFKDGKVVGSEDKDETILDAINAMLGAKKPDQMPKGLDKFRLYNRLSKSFVKAEKTKILELEEVDYKFVKDMIENDVPSTWGMNENLFKALESFLEAKSEESK